MSLIRGLTCATVVIFLLIIAQLVTFGFISIPLTFMIGLNAFLFGLVTE